MHVLKDENGNPIAHGGHEHTDADCGHCHSHEDHEHCPGHEHCHEHHAADPKEQMNALLDYMLKHNQHHAAELSQMVGKLQAMGKDEAAMHLGTAVAEFEKGNMYLALALSLVKE